MTNKEVFITLNTHQMSVFIYRYIVKFIGMRYTSSIEGVAQWLDEPKEEVIWDDFFKMCEMCGEKENGI